MRSIIFLSIISLVCLSFISALSVNNPEWIAEELNFEKESLGKTLVLADCLLLALLRNNFAALFVVVLLSASSFFLYNLLIFKKVTVLKE